MISDKFKEKMKNLLRDEYPLFIETVECGEAVKGLRVNLIKTETESFLDTADFDLEKLSYCDNGFIARGEGFGRTPEHHAGMMYMQDPGAMATLTALDIKSSWRVADLCSAPGGKSSQIAERIKDGFLLSNEYVPKRAKTVVSNFERLGVTNAIVTSLDTGELSKLFHEYFDLVVCDAPCSGEGMFRKSEDAIADWSEANILACAERQKEIMNNAYRLVKPGGYILYSTCTYSPEENEGVVSDFLDKHPDFGIVPVKPELRDATSDGLPEYGGGREEMRHTRRVYPHKTEGEGQYIALLKKDGSGGAPEILFKDASKPLSKDEAIAVNAFMRDNLVSTPNGEVRRVGDSIVLISHGEAVPPRSVFMSGVLVGELRGKLLVPSHQLFSAYGRLFKNRIELTKTDPRVEKYLGGEEIEVPNDVHGWCAVLYEGVPLGGGKASDGRLKNHYPKGLRLVK